MKTIKEWDQEIVKIISKIHQKYPELTKYIAEMPLKEAGNEAASIKNLKDYHQSLEAIVEKYAKTHQGANSQNQ